MRYIKSAIEELADNWRFLRVLVELLMAFLLVVGWFYYDAGISQQTDNVFVALLSVTGAVVGASVAIWWSRKEGKRTESRRLKAIGTALTFELDANRHRANELLRSRFAKNDFQTNTLALFFHHVEFYDPRTIRWAMKYRDALERLKDAESDLLSLHEQGFLKEMMRREIAFQELKSYRLIDAARELAEALFANGAIEEQDFAKLETDKDNRNWSVKQP